VTVTKTPIIVECSVIFSLAPGGVLPDSRIRLDAKSFAAGGAVTSRVSLPLQVGFFNNEPALYITPEVGVSIGSSFASLAQTIADGFNSNFVIQAFTSLPGTAAVDDIYVFTNASQGNVLASAPIPAGPSNNNAAYSPLWQVNLVSWNPGAKPRVLTSEADILTARSDGEVTIVPGATTGITVECSVIFTPQGGLLPGARITQVGGQRSALSDAVLMAVDTVRTGHRAFRLEVREHRKVQLAVIDERCVAPYAVNRIGTSPQTAGGWLYRRV
jgi:hypothetical protein